MQDFKTFCRRFRHLPVEVLREIWVIHCKWAMDLLVEEIENLEHQLREIRLKCDEVCGGETAI